MSRRTRTTRGTLVRLSLRDRGRYRDEHRISHAAPSPRRSRWPRCSSHFAVAACGGTQPERDVEPLGQRRRPAFARRRRHGDALARLHRRRTHGHRRLRGEVQRHEPRLHRQGGVRRQQRLRAAEAAHRSRRRQGARHLLPVRLLDGQPGHLAQDRRPRSPHGGDAQASTGTTSTRPSDWRRR